jgi:glycerol kinase
LAGLAVGYWESVDDLQEQWSIDRVFSPEMDKETVDELIQNWEKAVGRTKNWIE